MALIKCSECGRDVSDKASACPHCGNPLTPKIFCEDCGNEVSPNDKVCPKCGCPIQAKRETTTTNTSSTNNRPPLVLSNTEREYYHPKHLVFTTMIEAISNAKGLKLGVFEETKGVIRASTGVSIYSWGEFITINITELTPNSCRVKVQSDVKAQLVSWGKNDNNCALIFRILDFALDNPGRFL